MAGPVLVFSCIFRVMTPLPPTSLTPPARDAHPVSYCFLFPADRKWLDSTDTQIVGSWQEVISLQHLQPGNRTAPAGWWKNRQRTFTQTHIQTHRQLMTSPTAVCTGTTTQETSVSKPRAHRGQNCHHLPYVHTH